MLPFFGGGGGGQDAAAAGLARGLNQIYKNFDKKVKKRRMEA
jgi:hypothetical protein